MCEKLNLFLNSPLTISDMLGNSVKKEELPECNLYPLLCKLIELYHCTSLRHWFNNYNSIMKITMTRLTSVMILRLYELKSFTITIILQTALCIGMTLVLSSVRWQFCVILFWKSVLNIRIRVSLRVTVTVIIRMV